MLHAVKGRLVEHALVPVDPAPCEGELTCLKQRECYPEGVAGLQE